jgi:large subunit ribosomal protein L5
MKSIRLKQLYQDKAVKEMKQAFNLKNDMAVPKITKVVVSVGITEDQHQKQSLDNFAAQLEVITGQKPKMTVAKKSIANFKLRAGDPIGLMVTLRGDRMYQFMDKLFNIVLPRVKDFQGVKRTSFDANGNYNLGIEEQIIFPEIVYDKIDKVRGLQITFVTNTNNSQKAEKLLEILGMPFVKESNGDNK